MKKILVLLLTVTSLLWTSCGDITQEMWLKKDGSGELHMTYDAGALMALFLMVDQFGKDSATTEKNDFEAMFNDLARELYVKGEKADTSISLYDLALLEQKSNPPPSEELKHMNLHINADKEEESFVLSLRIDFENFIHLNQILESVPLDADKLSSDAITDFPDMDTLFVLNRKSFRVGAIDEPKSSTEDLDMLSDSTSTNADDLGLSEFLDLGDYILIYHLPRKIKSCSNERALIDGKTLTIKRPLKDFKDSKGFPGLTVKLK
ncbi:MAG: hypothetical protein KDC53_17400 [Saprospiraceae bacterium]|nr:hypothetical protein [Saprospiraceae bacterium]